MEKIHESDFKFLRTWVTFADSVMQLSLLSNQGDRSLFVPTGIESLLVDAEKLLNQVNRCCEQNHRKKSGTKSKEPEELPDQDESPLSDNQVNSMSSNHVQFPVVFDPTTRTLASEGLWIRGLQTSLVSQRPQKVIVESQEFIPLNEEDIIDWKLRKQLTKYQQTCDKYMPVIEGNQSSGVEQSDLITIVKQDFPFDENPSYALLRFLINCLEKNDVQMGTRGMDQDILIGRELQYSCSERFLRPFISIVLNNPSFSRKTNPSMHIIEYNCGKEFLFNTIKATIDALSIGTAELAYKIARPEHASPKESLEEKLPLINWDAESPLSGDVGRASLIIYKNHSGNITSFKAKVNHLIEAIIPGGFLLVIFRENVGEDLEKFGSIPLLENVLEDLKSCCMESEDVIKVMEGVSWTCISNRLLESKLIPIRGLLFREKPDSYEKPKIVKVSPMHFEWVEELKDLLKQEDNNSPICLIGDERYDQSITGFFRSIAMEIQDNKIFCIANRYHDDGIDLENLGSDHPELKQILEKRLKLNIYDPVRGWGEFNPLNIGREGENNSQLLRESSNHIELKVLQAGDLSSLKWCVSSPMKDKLERPTVKVCFASLNFKDVMLSTARLPRIFEPGVEVIEGDPAKVKIGLEFVGYDENNRRVMGAKGSGAMATEVSIGPTDLVWPVPEHWTLEDAATVPVVYATTIYGLIMRGNLRRGESVLIHAGSGGVGIAAIHLCLSYDCTIYTTVGTPEKRKFVLKRFPQLTEANIGNSRDTSFEEMVLRETGGRGVDIVLNSLADDKLQASIRCLAPGGRFIEIGKYDGFKNSPIELGLLDEGRSFHGVMLDSLFNVTEHQLPWVHRVEEQLNTLFEELLKNGAIQPLPRTVFEMDKAEEAFRYMAAGKHIGKVILKINDSRNEVFSSVPLMKTTNFCQEKVYIIVGGFGGLGLEVALWMSINGAGNIIINSRNGPKNSYHRYCLKKIAANNCKVTISKHDLTTESGTRDLFNSSSLPIGGIFNSALVLNDGLFADQTIESFTKVCASKVNITHNLDMISREMCPSLDYFVVFSSVSSGRGNIGQTNYGLANSFMESICERRRRDGRHGLAIQWGLIGDVGFVVEKMGANVESIRGTAAQRLHSCLSTLEKVLSYPHSTTTSMVRSEDTKLMCDSSGNIVDSICHILGIKDVHALDPKITLGELGMDSLMAIEVQQALERNFNVSIAAKEIRQLKVCDLIDLSKRNCASDTSENTTLIDTKIAHSNTGKDSPDSQEQPLKPLKL